MDSNFKEGQFVAPWMEIPYCSFLPVGTKCKVLEVGEACGGHDDYCDCEDDCYCETECDCLEEEWLRVLVDDKNFAFPSVVFEIEKEFFKPWFESSTKNKGKVTDILDGLELP